MNNLHMLREEESSGFFSFVNSLTYSQIIFAFVICVFLEVLFLLINNDCALLKKICKKNSAESHPEKFERAQPFSSERKVVILSSTDCITPRFFPDLEKDRQSVETGEDSDRGQENDYPEVVKHNNHNWKMQSRIMKQMNRNSKGESLTGEEEK